LLKLEEVGLFLLLQTVEERYRWWSVPVGRRQTLDRISKVIEIKCFSGRDSNKGDIEYNGLHGEAAVVST
jgi:hypothetical protein